MDQPVLVPEPLASILRDPVTLEPIDVSLPGNRSSIGFLDLRAGGRSPKNEAEISFARNEYVEPSGETYVDRLPHIQHPDITTTAVVLDIGCGPRDFLTGLPGVHIHLDDIMDSYVEELGARFGGTPICARTELMPFASGSIDVIYSINMLDHVDDMVRTAHELRRVVADGGCVVVQSYFNSHPLLPSEPGVFDGEYLRSVIEPLFVVEDVATHAVGGPTISDYYTMDIITCVLRPRSGATVDTGNRSRYAAEGFMGPQSHITAAIEALDAGLVEQATVHIEALADEPNYEVQERLLAARARVVSGMFSESLEIIKELRSHARVRRNPYARIALFQVDIERIVASTSGPQGRIAELGRAVEQRDARIAELDSAIVARDARRAVLDSAVRQRDERLRVSEEEIRALQAALAEQKDEIDALRAQLTRRRWRKA